MAKKKTVVEIDYNVKGTDKVKDSFDDINEKLKEVDEKLKEVDEKTKKYNESLKNTKKTSEEAKGGLKGMLNGMKAIVANPIGLVLTALAATVKLMSSAISGSEESSNKLAAAFAYVKGFIQPVINSFNDFVTSLGDGEEGAMNFVDTFKKMMKFWYEQTIAPPLNAVLIIFNTFEKAIFKVRKAWADFTGDESLSKQMAKNIEESNEKIKENAQAFVTFAENIKDVVVVAADVVKKISEDGEDMLDSAIKKGREMAQSLLKLTLAEQALTKERREQEVQNAKSLAQLEQLKVIRDDESKSLEERREANEKIADIEANRVNAALTLGEKELKLMQRRGELEGFSTELLDSIKDKEIELADFRNENAGIRAEQRVNDVNLRKEQFEKEAALVDQQLQLDSVLEESAVKIADAKIKAEEEKLAKLAELNLQETQQYRDQQFNLEMAQKEAEKARLDAKKVADNLLIEQDKITKDKQEQADKDSAKLKLDSQKALNDGISNLADSLSTALGENSKAALVIQKAVALRTIAIDTAQAISGLVKASAQNKLNGVTAGGAGALQFATGILQIGANMAQAYSILKAPAPQIDNKDNGSGPPPDTQQTAPDLGFDGRSAGTEQFGTQIPIRAYVTETDITTAQDTATNIQQLSQIG